MTWTIGCSDVVPIKFLLGYRLPVKSNLSIPTATTCSFFSDRNVCCLSKEYICVEKNVRKCTFTGPLTVEMARFVHSIIIVHVAPSMSQIYFGRYVGNSFTVIACMHAANAMWNAVWFLVYQNFFIILEIKSTYGY